MEARLGTMLYFLLVAVVFQCVQVQITSAVTCNAVSGNPCKCTLADGSGEIDLSPLFSKELSVKPATGPDSQYTFTYDACKPVSCGNPDRCSAGGGCLACQNGGGESIWGIASVNSVMWGEVTTPGYTFTINYENSVQSKKSQVSYTLDSGIGSPQFTFSGESPPDKYNMAVKGCFNTPTTNCAGGGGSSPGTVEAGWVGLVLISLCIVAVILYFAIGMPIMYFVKGARGIEMIPLVNFWKDFPFLLKDGFMFTLFGWPCCKNMRPQAYSKI